MTRDVGFAVTVQSNWLRATISNQGGDTALEASYAFGDAMEELLLALRRLTTYETDAQASWGVGPGEYRWVFHKYLESLHVLVVACPQWTPQRQPIGETVLEIDSTVTGFVRAVVRGCQALLTEIGEDGYLAAFGHPFPTADLSALA